MNQAEVVHASWTNRDPPNMSLLDVCMADVKDTVIIETELEGIKNGTCQAGTRGPSYAELQRRRHDREVQKAKRAGKEMFENNDGHLIDQKSSYQPKNRKASATRKKSQTQILQPAPSRNNFPSDPPAAQDSFAFDPQYSSIPCPPSSHSANQTTYAPQTAFLNMSQPAVSQNPNTPIQPSPMTFGPQPSPGFYTPNNGPQNKQVPAFVAPQAASSMAAPYPAVAAQWQPWMSPYAYELCCYLQW